MKGINNSELDKAVANDKTGNARIPAEKTSEKTGRESKNRDKKIGSVSTPVKSGRVYTSMPLIVEKIDSKTIHGVWRLLTRIIDHKANITNIGLENIPASGPVIFVSNHTSNWDALYTVLAIINTNRIPTALAKAELWKVPLLRRLFDWLKLIPVYRNSSRAKDSLVDARKALKEGRSIMIFPEGTTMKEGDFIPKKLKTGAARLAIETGVPVVPVAVDGTLYLSKKRSEKYREYLEEHDGEYIKEYDYTVDKNSFFTGKKPNVTVKFGEPLNLSCVQLETFDYTKEDLHAVCDIMLEYFVKNVVEMRKQQTLKIAKLVDRGR